MLIQNNRPHHSKIVRVCSGTLFLLSLLFVLFPTTVFAQSGTPADNGPGIKTVVAGFHGKFQNGNWIPVQVTLANTGSDFSGKVSISVPLSQVNGSPGVTIYQTAITLPAGAQKKTTLYVPVDANSGGSTSTLNVDLLDANGHKVDTYSAYLSSLSQGDMYVGILSDQKSSFGAINAVNSVLNTSAQVNTEILDATTFPTNAAVLKNFDVLVLDNFTTGALSHEQLAALQNWVNQGGSLIATGGSEWRHTLAPLPTSLLPVTVTGTDHVVAGTHLIPVGGPTKSNPVTDPAADTLAVPVDISVAQARTGSNVLLSSNNTPLVVEGNSGQGNVYYLAYDPALAPLVSWSNNNQLWSALIMRVQGNKILSGNSTVAGNSTTQVVAGYNPTLQQLLIMFTPNTSTAIWIILALLLGYILVLGPLRLLLVHRMKKRTWSWRIVLVTIVLFTLLSYGLAIQQKGTTIIGTSISVIQLSSPDSTGSTEHITNYMGVFVPNQGDFHVLLPDSGVVQSTDGNNQTSSIPQTTINLNGDTTDVNLQGVNTWSLRSFVSQQDQHTQGGIISHLTLQNGTVTGNVTNTLPYTVKNAYVLVDRDYISLGNLQAGQSHSLSLILTNSLNNANTQQTPLGQSISNNNNVQPVMPYYMMNQANQPQDELHRQMEMLTAIGGNGCGYTVPCGGIGGMVIVGKGMFQARRTGNTADPLLLPGAVATFIGWVDSSSKLNVNGNAVDGTHETLLQAPLSIAYTGAITVPADLITSQVVDVQESTVNNVQSIAQGAYSLATGSMTFEYTLPANLKVQNGTLTVTDTAINVANGYYNAAQAVGGSTQTVSDINQAHCSMYNWQTGNWDSVTFVQGKLTSNNAQAYIDQQGHILLQVGNTDGSQSTTLISQPAIQLQGSVAN